MNTKTKKGNISTTLTIRVDCSIKKRLEEAAERMKRSKSFLAAEAIEEFLEVQDWQTKGIKDALRSLNNGKGVPHEDVVAWVESWGSDKELPEPTA